MNALPVSGGAMDATAEMDLCARWEAAWDAVQAVPRTGLFETMIARYSALQRTYHNVQHLREVLAALDQLSGQGERTAEVELALWFHDAIHDVDRADNELRSAELARVSLLKSGAASEVADRVHSLVMAAAHAGEVDAPEPDPSVIRDCDLWILGAPSDRFDEYERQIRIEYDHVPDAIYAAGRRAVLERLLNAGTVKGSVYRTPRAQAWAGDARVNLARSLQSLCSSTLRLGQG